MLKAINFNVDNLITVFNPHTLQIWRHAYFIFFVIYYVYNETFHNFTDVMDYAILETC